jgi:hypothetical protein
MVATLVLKGRKGGRSRFEGKKGREGGGFEGEKGREGGSAERARYRESVLQSKSREAAPLQIRARVKAVTAPTPRPSTAEGRL